MIAKITTGTDVYGALAYNHHKVDQGVAKILSTHIIREPSNGQFSISETTEDLLRWMPTHYRTEKPVIHISLNPDPKDCLSDSQLVEIAATYMDRMGYGTQPYIVFKHTDIDREHIHIVSLQVRPDGRKIKDSKRNERSVAITEQIEKEYKLHPTKGQTRSEQWQLAPVDPAKGNLKTQISNVIKQAATMYRFQTLGEFRALLSLYNIGIEEVGGERNGKPYRGLLYTVLDAAGGGTSRPPLKSSNFGKSVGADELECHMEQSALKIEKDSSQDYTRRRVTEALCVASTESDLRANLQSRNIDLYLRRNATGRITGVTFIDHENRCVLNGSRLGKAYSANIIQERFSKQGLDEAGIIQRPLDIQHVKNPSKRNQQKHKLKK